jgi:hypothetical protein
MLYSRNAATASGGLAMDEWGNWCFVGGSGDNSWHVFSSYSGAGGSDLICVYYDGRGFSFRGNFWSFLAGGNGYENGYVGTSAHRFTGAYIRTVYTLGGGGYDEYDDLALVKQWGEKQPAIPVDYDPTKKKPQDNDPFSMLRAKNPDGTLDEYFNLNELVSFSLGCTKTLAKKQDEYSATLLELFKEKERLSQEIADLRLQLQKITAQVGVSA